MVLRPVLHAARHSGAKHGIMVGWVFELWWSQTNAGPSSHLTHVLNGTHGQGSPSNDWLQAAVTHQYRPLAPRCHFTTALPCVAWPDLAPPSLPAAPCGQAPPAHCGVPLHKGVAQPPGWRSRDCSRLPSLALISPVPSAPGALCPPVPLPASGHNVSPSFPQLPPGE